MGSSRRDEASKVPGPVTGSAMIIDRECQCQVHGNLAKGSKKKQKRKMRRQRSIRDAMRVRRQEVRTGKTDKDKQKHTRRAYRGEAPQQRRQAASRGTQRAEAHRGQGAAQEGCDGDAGSMQQASLIQRMAGGGTGAVTRHHATPAAPPRQRVAAPAEKLSFRRR